VKTQLQEIATAKNQAGKTIAQLKDDTERQRMIARMSELKEQEMIPRQLFQGH